MSFTGIHHIVIRVSDLTETVAEWRANFGLEAARLSENADLGVKQAMFDLADGSFIELVSPLTDDSAMAKAIANRGEGLHLVSLSVNDVQTTIESFDNAGVKLLGSSPGPRFVHPTSASGVLLGIANAATDQKEGS